MSKKNIILCLVITLLLITCKVKRGVCPKENPELFCKCSIELIKKGKFNDFVQSLDLESSKVLDKNKLNDLKRLKEHLNTDTIELYYDYSGMYKDVVNNGIHTVSVIDKNLKNHERNVLMYLDFNNFQKQKKLAFISFYIPYWDIKLFDIDTSRLIKYDADPSSRRSK